MKKFTGIALALLAMSTSVAVSLLQADRASAEQCILLVFCTPEPEGAVTQDCTQTKCNFGHKPKPVSAPEPVKLAPPSPPQPVLDLRGEMLDLAVANPQKVGELNSDYLVRLQSLKAKSGGYQHPPFTESQLAIVSRNPQQSGESDYNYFLRILKIDADEFNSGKSPDAQAARDYAKEDQLKKASQRAEDEQIRAEKQSHADFNRKTIGDFFNTLFK
jgi:hypothetical protein